MLNNNPHFFWGGVDIDPTLYKQTLGIHTQHPNYKRDQKEIAEFHYCVKNNIPMIGICRGAQLLNVLNGGSLHQDVTKHTKDHTIKVLKDKQEFEVTSTHHQMMVPSTDGEVLAIAPFPCMVQEHPLKDLYKSIEHGIEVVYYPKTKSLCIQFHPEWMSENSQAVKWLKELVKELWNINVSFTAHNDMYYGDI